MKKSLIALAALAVVGAASAQSTVNIGGLYSFGFQKSDSGATKADFFDARVNFSGTEDLGGGLKASFFTEMQMGGRQDLTTVDSTKNQAKIDGVFGRNATVSLAGGFGTITGGRVESTNTHEGARLARATLADNFDKAGLAGALSNFNTVGYTSPAFGGLRASLSQSKSLNDKFAPAATAANAETTINTVGATYAAGPVAAGLAYKMVDSANATKGKKTELFATYDLGVAKVGVGFGKNSGAAYVGEKATVILSAVAPVAPNFTIGVDYAKRDAGGASADKDGKGHAIAANYDLSKRTRLNATIGKVEGKGLIGENQYRVGMFHTF